MKILLTGANGYIGKKLLPSLISQGHEVICCVRDRNKLPTTNLYNNHKVSVVECDFIDNPKFCDKSIHNIDVAYYLIHSMTDSYKGFEKKEEQAARNFLTIMGKTSVRQIIYLGAITNEDQLSQHLASRKNVETILKSGSVPVTSLKAGIIVGCGSASFEIIRKLIETFPLIVGPDWLNTRSQPVSLINVIEFLTRVLLNPDTYNKSIDMGGAQVMTYKQMLKEYAAYRGLKRFVFTIPGIPLQMAALFLSIVSKSGYNLTLNLIQSMKIDIVAKRDQEIENKLQIKPLSYKEAIDRCCGF